MGPETPRIRGKAEVSCPPREGFVLPAQAVRCIPWLGLATSASLVRGTPDVVGRWDLSVLSRSFTSNRRITGFRGPPPVRVQPRGHIFRSPAGSFLAQG